MSESLSVEQAQATLESMSDTEPVDWVERVDQAQPAEPEGASR